MKLRLLLVVLLSLGLFSTSCSTSSEQPDDEVPSGQTQKAIEESDSIPVGDSPTPGVESDILPIGDSAVLGERDAPVTVVAFSDFQCPFCARGAQTMHQLIDKYPNDVRVVFKHYPLPFHKQAPGASKAAIAAGKQGKFWQMHDWLFENQHQFKAHAGSMKEWTAQHAKEMGLDAEQFKADFDAPETQAQLHRDMKLGEEVAVRGTPHFFVNGERVKGAKPLSDFDAVVKRQLKDAEALLADGDATRDNLYAKAVAKDFDKNEQKPRRRRKPKTIVSYVPVDSDDPMMGETKDPLVTIVEFSDFQCPFCKKVLPTVEKISEEYGDQVRVVFKQLPLPMHAQAKPAAKAALAAHEQGAFWAMHDKLFEKQSEMRSNANNFEDWAAGFAKEIGLDVDKFRKDYNSDAIAQKVEGDTELSQKVGARGTPNFFINGVNMRGAQPYSAFEAEIDKQIQLAKNLRDTKELSGEALYKAAVAENEKTRAQDDVVVDKQPSADKPAPKVDLADLAVGEAPIKGPKDAPVTIVAFSDFQCPYCKRGAANVEEAMAKHKDSVRLVYKHYPLPFHKQAKPAARAVMAAGEQGMFWQMHDKLFENQRRLKQDGIFKELAKELGLDVSKFEKDMKNPEYDKIIDQDMKQGQKVGVRGTPVFFINGTRVVGAQPTKRFEAGIKEALDEAK